MAEYIERGEVIEKNHGGVVYIDDIKNIPSSDVASVRHGRWLRFRDYNGNSILVCSECGRVCHEEDAPYCYCGAKMDGGFDNG